MISNYSVEVNCSKLNNNNKNHQWRTKIMSQSYSLDEVKTRNGQNGARTWIVIHDIVYDVTDYLNDVREKTKFWFEIWANWIKIDKFVRMSSVKMWGKKYQNYVLASRRWWIDIRPGWSWLYKGFWWFWTFERCQANYEEIQSWWIDRGNLMAFFDHFLFTLFFWSSNYHNYWNICFWWICSKTNDRIAIRKMQTQTNRRMKVKKKLQNGVVNFDSFSVHKCFMCISFLEIWIEVFFFFNL